MRENGIEEEMKEWRGYWRDEGLRAYWMGYGREQTFTILMEATLAGRSDVLKWLIQDLQFDVNEKNNIGKTALHCAAYRNQMECARLLLSRKALLLKDQDGDTPLDWLYIEGRFIGRKDMENLLESHFHSINES